jgi:hypothetical protein
MRMTRRLAVLSLAFLVLFSLSAFIDSKAANNRNIPAPLRVSVPFETAWKTALAAFEALQERNGRKVPLIKEDRNRGEIKTDFVEYASGPLAAGHIAKIGERPRLSDGDWVRVEYQYEVLLELIQDKETLTTVSANIKALKRSFLGEEQWVNIATNGTLEQEYLMAFGTTLFGERFQLETPSRGFWSRDPGHVPRPADEKPKVVGPERRVPQ